MTQVTTPPLDEARKGAFGERLLEILNNAGVAMMTSIGHRAGLFDAMAGQGPASSGEIADRAGLQERYVREWLGAMVTGRIVEHDHEAGTYCLPAEHAAWLTRTASPDNVAATMQWVSVLGGVERDVVECFTSGGGVPYERYADFHRVMAEESGQTVVTALLEHIVPLVPGLPARLEAGIDVLDVGCGAGRAMNALAATYPRSRFAGYDLSEEAIATAREEARSRGLGNARFEARDVSAIGEQQSYDLITAFDAIHDQRDPAGVLREIHAALRPGGTFLMQDIAGSSHVHKNLDLPLGPFMYTISCMHCMTVSLAQGGAGLGAMWGEELAVRMLGEAGFGPVEVKRLPHDIINSYYIAARA